MRKIVAVFLLLAMLTVFVSCGKGDNDETTNGGIITGSQTMQPATTTTQPSTTDANAAATYILTTSPDRTVPWGETTKFSTTSASTTQPSTIVINIPTEANTSPVTPNYSEAPTTTTTATTTTAATTTKPTTTEISTVKQEDMKGISISDDGSSIGDGVLYINISPDNFPGGINANSIYLTVYVDGTALEKKAKFSLGSTLNADGCYEITGDITGASLADGNVVSVSIPEGFIKTKNGAVYNYEFSVSSTS